MAGMSDVIKSSYNAATGVMVEEKPARLSGGKRPISHPEVAVDMSAAGQQKKPKKTYTPQQSKEKGHYHVVLGEDVDGTPDLNRWKILDLLGEGTFAKVIEAWDRKRKAYVAIKLVRAVEKYTRDAKFEIGILHRIKQDDAQDFYPTIKYRTYFYANSKLTGNHMCIVFPKLGFCLLDYLNRCGKFKLHEIAHIAWQLGAALNYMHAHLKLLHTDLKPENILLEEPVETVDKAGTRKYNLPPKTKIRVIDYGGTTDERHGRTTIVSTRHYRAPEVITGAGWMWGADIWSVGCILIELFTGRLLYETHENREHLALMERTLKKFPTWMWRYSTAENQKFFGEERGGEKELDTTWLNEPGQSKSATKVRAAQHIRFQVHDRDFLDLLTQCLEYDKTRRIRAHDIMYHPFVLKNYPEATAKNEKREAYEKSNFGHVLGAPEAPTRVRDPAYTPA